MITVDTNVWVRYLTNDDPDQAGRALRLLKSADEVFVPKTVLLEMEWVLRAVYELSATDVLKSLLTVLGLPIVRIEQPEQVACAIDLYRQGLDFADALHLVAGGEQGQFYTFDVKSQRKGVKLGAGVSLA